MKDWDNYYLDEEAEDPVNGMPDPEADEARQRARRRNERRRRKRVRILRKRILTAAGIGGAGALAVFLIVHFTGSLSADVEAHSESAAVVQTIPTGETAAAAETTDGEQDAADLSSDETVFTEDADTVVLSSVHRSPEGSEEDGTGQAQSPAEADSEGSTPPEATSSEADTSTEPQGENYSFDQAFIDSSVEGGFSGTGTDYVSSEYAILVDLDTGRILLDRDAMTRMNPASMTKVMTVLVAAEHLKSDSALQEKVTITQDVVDECYLSGLSSMYYMNGDQRTVEELFYGTILPSGADAAYALAKYTAGSEEAFADLMNEKCEELGIGKTTHFTNPVGCYGEDHYTTCYDMAVIMKAAMENDLCRKVLSAHTYDAAPSLAYPEGGHTVSNWFLRRIEDKDTHGTVIGAKTGFVNESGCCAVSLQQSDDGGRYICCTADTWGSWRAIYDHVAIYSHFTN